MTPRCMQFTFGDKREVNLQGESFLPVTEKESMQEGKREYADPAERKMNYKVCVSIFQPRADDFFPFRILLSCR